MTYSVVIEVAQTDPARPLLKLLKPMGPGLYERHARDAGTGADSIGPSSCARPIPRPAATSMRCQASEAGAGTLRVPPAALHSIAAGVRASAPPGGPPIQSLCIAVASWPACSATRPSDWRPPDMSSLSLTVERRATGARIAGFQICAFRFQVQQAWRQRAAAMRALNPRHVYLWIEFPCKLVTTFSFCTPLGYT
jgi:hypothetical protein